MGSEHPKLFISGNSSGLGRGLSEELLQQGWQVYGCSRHGCDLEGTIEDIRCDLSNLDLIPERLTTLLQGVERLELVILNAGMLGRIEMMHNTSLDEIRAIMDLNVWSNKVILDWLHASGIRIGQIVMISSGAAVLGNKGWGGYALSKSALNMLARLYAHEFPETHISALAPGLIDSKMMDYLCEEADHNAFPGLQRIREARGTAVMPTPREAAERVIRVLPELNSFPSGSFIDIRQIDAPEEYAALMAARNGS